MYFENHILEIHIFKIDTEYTFSDHVQMAISIFINDTYRDIQKTIALNSLLNAVVTGHLCYLKGAGEIYQLIHTDLNTFQSVKLSKHETTLFNTTQNCIKLMGIHEVYL